MATTAKVIVPDTKAKGQKRRKPLSKAHKAKLASALADWLSSLTEEDKAELGSIQRLAGSWQADVTRRHVSAGMATDTEKVAAVSDPHDLGMSPGEDAPSYVEQAIAGQ